MHFRKYLTEDGVFLDKNFNSLEEVLRFLAAKLAVFSRLPEEKIYRLLYEREQLSSTWVGHETMLPHNHSPEVEGIHMIFIRCNKLLTLPGGEQVKYIFSILTSGSQGDLYIGILQGIGELIKNHAVDVEACETSGELFDLLTSSRYIMGTPLTAGDLARSWPVVKASDPLSVALDTMKQADVYFLPVVSELNGRICGVLDLVDLLKAGFPDYVFSLNNLSVVSDFQPLKYFWKNESEFLIRDFIRDFRLYTIREDVSYPEIFFMMIKGNRRHLLVLNEREELVGVIHPHEIINKMLRP